MKKLITTLTILILSLFALSSTAFAEAKTDLPVTIKHSKSYGTVRIDSFKVKSISETSSKSEIEIQYEFKYTEISGTYPAGYLVVKCYDSNGTKIKTIDLNPYTTSMKLPKNTATIKFDSEKPVSGGDAYVYREYVNVYAPDGRVRQITRLQVPAYKSVGWSEATVMYARDADGKFTRTKLVSPFKIKEYQAVGWYTYEGAVFSTVKRECKNYSAKGDYNSVIDMVAAALEDLRGTEYEKQLYAIRTEAMDKWRNKCGTPMDDISYKVSENSVGTPEVTIYFRNLSYKKITAYKIKFTCYDAFGNVEKSYYDYFYDDDANLGVAKAVGATWVLYGADSVKEVKNIRIVEVVFEDETKWKA